jgi:MATE family multidrug resistance protein
MKFGLPAGFQMMLDGIAWTSFVILVHHLGTAEMSATGIAFAINLVAFLPPMGVGNAVAILVGQRLGEDRPDLADKTTWTGFLLTWAYMTAAALLYLVLPEVFLDLFASPDTIEDWAAVEPVAIILLRFVAIYSLFESMNIIFSSALRGAGDTVFVSAMSFFLAVPILVIPTGLVVYYRGSLYWAWTAATTYVILAAFAFLWRFTSGRWKSMRVIEPVVAMD